MFFLFLKIINLRQLFINFHTIILLRKNQVQKQLLKLKNLSLNPNYNFIGTLIRKKQKTINKIKNMNSALRTTMKLQNY